MQYLVRPATPDDFTAIQALNHLLFLYEKQFTQTYNEWWPYQQSGIDYFLRRLLNQDNYSIFLVVEQNSQVIGYLAGYLEFYSYRNLNPIAEIENMFVLPNYRSRGVGTTLVQEFLKQAKSLGAKRFRVSALASNHPALSFYQKLGFTTHETTLEM